ncbi:MULTISPECIES: hypothetical protein [unclassified Streptomyces]|uniref:hypothetical protein n=1 Tax=unclassified Streptomyces TaxID=2593676 RepID=UPI002E290EAD|nr:hypothetical protein [Streptomyces sp. NBC_01429]
MSRHLGLRAAVLSAVAAGALLVPTSAAFASSDPTPVPADQAPSTAPAGKRAEDAAAADKKAEDAAAAKAGISREEYKKMQDLKTGRAAQPAPRGGVAAGEAPAADSGFAALAGTAAGGLLLAGAGTFVLRRRSAERHTA